MHTCNRSFYGGLSQHDGQALLDMLRAMVQADSQAFERLFDAVYDPQALNSGLLRDLWVHLNPGSKKFSKVMK